jgi:hypothetical protein
MENRLIKNFDTKRFAYIRPFFTEEKFKEFKKRLFIGLQKYQTSSKTRTVHHIYENNLIYPATFTNGFTDFGVTANAENKLLRIIFNASYCADFVINENADVLIIEINNLFVELDKQKELISEYQIKNIQKITEKINKKLDEFINIFDYMKIADITYYLFLRFLLKGIFLKHPTLKMKIINQTQIIFTKLFLKIYNKTTRSPIDDEIKKKFDLISTYLILNYYAGLTFREVLAKIKGAYGEGAVELLKKTNKTKLEKFEDIVEVMFDTGIFKIQKSLFDTFMRKYVSEIGYIKIKESLADTVAVFSSINHKNVIFNILSPFEKDTRHLEELTLNYKSKVILPKVQVSFKG